MCIRDSSWLDGGRSVEAVLATFANVVHCRADVLVAVDRLLLGNVAEHLDPEPAVEVVSNTSLPRPAHDLSGETSRHTGLGHDVVGQLVAALDESVPRHHFVHEAVLE